MFVVIHTEAVPNSLTGFLSRYLYELESGLFVGRTSRRLYEHLWSQVEAWASPGHAVGICSSKDDQGFALRQHNHPVLTVLDLDGLSVPLITSRSPAKSPTS